MQSVADINTQTDRRCYIQVKTESGCKHQIWPHFRHESDLGSELAKIQYKQSHGLPLCTFPALQPDGFIRERVDLSELTIDLISESTFATDLIHIKSECQKDLYRLIKESNHIQEKKKGLARG